MEPKPDHLLSIQLGAFVDQIPPSMVGKTVLPPSRTITVAKEDVFIDEEAGTVAVPLSILSLSCPDIFSRPISSEEDQPVTFSLHYQAPSPVAASGDLPIDHAWWPEFLTIFLKNIALTFPPDFETPEIRELIHSEVVIQFPFRIIEPQIASGKIVISAEQLKEILPSDLKTLLDSVEPTAEIPMPLAEVIAQLPAEAMQQRVDQDNIPESTPILTPFYEHAREDAERFGEEPAPVPVLAPAAGEAPPPLLVEEPLPTAQESPQLLNMERLQAIFMTHESLDLDGAMAHIARLPGLKGSILTDREGRRMAGTLRELDREADITSLLPQLFRQIDPQIRPLQIGGLETLTLHCGRQQLSVFLHEGYSLIVQHENMPFKPGVREKIKTVLAEIA